MNKFRSIFAVREKFTKKANRKGYADLLKTITETIVNRLGTLDEEYDFRDHAYHVTDVNYSDGYYVFGTGDNTVVSFHVKETPDWLYGIWWKIPEVTRKEKRSGSFFVEGQLFAQYEKTIDKFKPSRSNICLPIKVKIFDGSIAADILDTCEIYETINFIHTEPELAFCRDYYFWDLNTTYHTREEAQERYEAYLVQQEKLDNYRKICDQKLYNCVHRLFAEQLKSGNAKLMDLYRDGMSEIVLKRSAAEALSGETIKCKDYVIYPMSELLPDSYNIFSKTVEQIEGSNNNEELYWYTNIDDGIYVVEDSKFDYIGSDEWYENL